MHPDQLFQHHRSDEVRRTASRIAAVVGANKVVLPLLKIAGGAVPHLCAAIGTVDHTGKQAALAGSRPAVALLADFLNLVKDFLLDDCRVGVVEYRLFFKGRVPLLLVPDRVGVGLEIDRTAGIFPALQNVNNGVGVQ